MEVLYFTRITKNLKSIKQIKMSKILIVVYSHKVCAKYKTFILVCNINVFSRSRTPSNEFLCGLFKNSFGFVFPIPENPGVQKIKRFEELFEQSIFPRWSPKG